MATESLTCLKHNGPKTIIAVSDGGIFTTLACKTTKTKLPSYSSLNSQEMPLYLSIFLTQFRTHGSTGRKSAFHAIELLIDMWMKFQLSINCTEVFKI